MDYLSQCETDYEKKICPICGNADLQVASQTIINTEGKDYSAGKGCLGLFLLGPIGLLCGACGKGKQMSSSNSVMWICPECGTIVDSDTVGDDVKKRSCLGHLLLAIVAFAIVVISFYFLNKILVYLIAETDIFMLEKKVKGIVLCWKNHIIFYGV